MKYYPTISYELRRFKSRKSLLGAIILRATLLICASNISCVIWYVTFVCLRTTYQLEVARRSTGQLTIFLWLSIIDRNIHCLLRWPNAQAFPLRIL